MLLGRIARLRANDDHPTKTAICISLASSVIDGLDSSISGIVRVAATHEPGASSDDRVGVRPRPLRGGGGEIFRYQKVELHRTLILYH